MEDETLRRQRNDLSNMPIHMPDAGSDHYEIEHMLGLMDSERKLMKEIDEALERQVEVVVSEKPIETHDGIVKQ